MAGGTAPDLSGWRPQDAKNSFAGSLVFRDDLPTIDIPVLVLHGTEDRILPIEACGARTHELIKDSEYVPIQGAPHGLCWTHADEVNAGLLRFFG